MDIGRALTFFTQDERWVEKTAIGTAVILISMLLSVILVGLVGFFIVLGYGVRLMRNVRDDVQPVLPEWDQWGDDLVRGFKLMVVGLVWTLPVWLLMVPVFVGSAMAEAGQAAQFFGTLLLLGSSCLLFLYSLFVAFLSPGYTIAFAERERIGDGLAVGAIWSWSLAHLGQVVVVVLTVLIASFVVSFVGLLAGLLLCLIGLVVTLPLSTLVTTYIQFHLYGQLARTGPVVGSAPSEPPQADPGEDSGWEPVVPAS